MMNHNRTPLRTLRKPGSGIARPFALRAIAGTSVFTGLLAVSMLSGCGQEEEEAPPPPPVRTTQAPPPKIDTMSGIMLDPRVQWPEENHPSTVELAQAVADLVNALAKADANAFMERLAPEDAALTRELVNFGLWQQQMKGIEAVRVCVLNETSADTAELGIGLQTAKGAYMIAFRGQTSSPWVFRGLGIADIEAPRVAMLDGSPLTLPMIPEAVQFVPPPEEKKQPEDDGSGGDGGDYEPPAPSAPGDGIPKKPRRHYR